MKLEHSKLVKQLNCQIRNALFPIKVTVILIYSLKKSCPELIIPRGNSLLLNIFVDVFLKQRKKPIISQTCFVWLILGESHLFHQESPISPISKKNSIIQVTHQTPFSDFAFGHISCTFSMIFLLFTV